MKTTPTSEHPLAEYFARMAVDMKNVQRLGQGQHAMRIETEIRRTIARELGVMPRPTCRLGVFVCLVRHIAKRDSLPWVSFEQYLDAAIAKILYAEFLTRKEAQ